METAEAAVDIATRACLKNHSSNQKAFFKHALRDRNIFIKVGIKTAGTDDRPGTAVFLYNYEMTLLHINKNNEKPQK